MSQETPLYLKGGRGSQVNPRMKKFEVGEWGKVSRGRKGRRTLTTSAWGGGETRD